MLGGEEVLRVPWEGGELPHRVRTLAPPHRIPGRRPVDGRPHVWSQHAPGKGVSLLWLEGAGHDLSNPLRQQALEAPMRSAAFTAAALDCSTKSRAREIPRTFAGPKPLRSEVHPEGLPGLDPKNQRRVDVDNAACSWILRQLQAIADDGREPCGRTRLEASICPSLWSPASGATRRTPCVFMSARCKHQRLRREIELIHPRECHHQHAA